MNKVIRPYKRFERLTKLWRDLERAIAEALVVPKELLEKMKDTKDE